MSTVSNISPWGFRIGPVTLSVEGQGPRGFFPGFAPTGTPTLRLRSEILDVLPTPPGKEIVRDESFSIFVDDEVTSFVLRTGLFGGPAEIACVEIAASRDRGRLLIRRGVTQNPLRWRPLEELIVLHCIAPNKGALIHAGSLATKDFGCVLFGPSGAGKTTFTRASHKLGGVDVLSDERVIVRGAENGWLVEGTPWPGEGRFCTNRSVPLRGVLWLEKSDRDALEPLSPARALSRLYTCSFPAPWLNFDGLDTLEQLVKNVPAFVLHNRLGGQAQELVRTWLDTGHVATPAAQAHA